MLRMLMRALGVRPPRSIGCPKVGRSGVFRTIVQGPGDCFLDGKFFAILGWLGFEAFERP